MAILGGGGSIGNELAEILAAKNAPIRLVARNPRPFGGAEIFAADLSDREQTLQAVSGSNVVCLLVGLKYDLAVWRELWPRIMSNTIEACKRAQARLMFFDNVYIYGKSRWPNDRANALRAFQQERRGARGDRKTLMVRSQRGQSRQR